MSLALGTRRALLNSRTGVPTITGFSGFATGGGVSIVSTGKNTGRITVNVGTGTIPTFGYIELTFASTPPVVLFTPAAEFNQWNQATLGNKVTFQFNKDTFANSTQYIINYSLYAANLAPAFDPSSISGLVFAIDPNVSALVTSVNGITTIGGAYGTATAVTGGSTTQTAWLVPESGPASANASPTLPAMMRFDGAAIQHLFHGQVHLTGDSTTVLVFSGVKDFEAQRAIIGDTGASGSAIFLALNAGQVTTPKFQIRTNGGTLTDFPITGGINKAFHVAIFSYVQSTGVMSCNFDGVEQTPVTFTTEGFQFSKIGNHNSANYYSGYLGMELLYNVALGSTDRATLAAGLATWVSSTIGPIHVSSVDLNASVGLTTVWPNARTGGYDLVSIGASTYLTTQQRGSVIKVDRAHPNGPTFVAESSRRFTTDNRGIVAKSTTAVIASNTSNSTIEAYDPTTLASLGFITDSTNLRGCSFLAIDGNVLYCPALNNNKLTALNVTTLASMTVTGSVAVTSPRCVMIWISGSRALVTSDGNSALYLVDITTPGAMVLKATLTGLDSCVPLAMDFPNRRVFVGNGGHNPPQIFSILVGDPGTDTLTLEGATAGMTGGQLAIVNKKIFGGDFNTHDNFLTSPLQMGDITVPTAIVTNYTSPKYDELRGIKADPSNSDLLLALEDSGSKFHIFDIRHCI